MAVALTPGQLRINDIIFDVPPTSIQIIKREHNSSIPTIRSTSSTKIKSGKKDVLFIIDLKFPTGYNFNLQEQQTAVDLINRQLAPLVIQTRKCPFCSIENEKIRKEMAGELSEGEVAFKNMAGCIKSIRATADLNSPEFINVQLVIKWFNYTPYSPYFQYLADIFTLNQKASSGSQSASEILQDFTETSKNSLPLESRFNNTPRFSADRLVPVDSPEDSDQYKLFYMNGTIDPSTGRFINEVSSFTNQIELVYKEYSEQPRSQGWTRIDSTLGLGEDVYTRYNSFKLSPAEIRKDSGALIPVSLELLLETKVPSLPLLGQSVPTLQYLGCSDGLVNLSLFANSELDGRKPVATSFKLNELSNVLERVYKNSIRYRALSKRDPIFIKHPLVNLFQYNLFDRGTIDYVDDRNNLQTVNTSSLLPVLINSVDTATVEGAPFCSRVDLQFIEAYSKTEESTNLVNQGLSVDIYKSTLEALDKTIDEAGINFNTTRNSFESNINDINRTVVFAESLRKNPAVDIDKLNYNTLVFNLLELLNTKHYSDDPKKQLRAVLDDESAFSEQRRVFDRLTRLIVESRPRYLEFYRRSLLQSGSTSPNSAYPDMLLPLKEDPSDERRQVGRNPDFYWKNESDITLPETKENGIPVALRTFERVFKDALNNLTVQETVEQNLSRPVKAGKRPPLNITNGIRSEDVKESVKDADLSRGAVHAFGSIDNFQANQGLVLASSISNIKDHTYTMRRAMPAYKLFFMQDSVPFDKTDLRDLWLNFEDFFNVNSIKDIRLVKSKHIAADTLVLQVLNLDRDLVNADFPVVAKKDGSKSAAYAQIDGEFITEKRVFQQPFEKFDNIMLNEGTRVQLRLGYDSDPDNLSIEFNGRITQISGSDVLEIVCQSHAVELEQDTKGVEEGGETFSFNSETNDLISKLIFSSEEIQSFGSRGDNKYAKSFDFGGRFLAGGFLGGVSISDNLFAPPLGFNFGQTVMDGLLDGATVGGSVGSLFAGVGALPGTAIGAVAGAGLKAIEGVKSMFFKVPFTVYQQTVWEVIKELELRHPDCIASVVPYDNRMTLFFGYPEQLYFYRGFHTADPIADKLVSTNLLGQRATIRRFFDNAINQAGFNNHELTTLTDSKDKTKITDSLKDLLHYMRPFRNYHKVTAAHDIIINNIRADLTGTFNAVKIYHPKDSDDANFDGSIGFQDYEASPTISADDDLHSNFIRQETFVQHNAVKWENVNLPEQYAISILQKSLAKLYKGELLITGRPDIKPYDVIFIFDDYTGITGAIEVEQVIQHLSYDQGWVTEITPNMLIYTNNLAGRAHLEAVQQVMAAEYFKQQSLYLTSKFDLDVIVPEAIRQEEAKHTTESSVNAVGNFANFVLGKRVVTSVIDEIKRSGVSGASFAELKSNAAANAKAFSQTVKNARTAEGIGTAAGKATKGLAAASGSSFRFATNIAKRAGGAGLTLIAGLFFDNTVENFISWAGNREPLIFVPLKRNGKPWTLGLYGLKPDSTIDSVRESFSDFFDDSKLFLGKAIAEINRINIDFDRKEDEKE